MRLNRAHLLWLFLALSCNGTPPSPEPHRTSPAVRAPGVKAGTAQRRLPGSTNALRTHRRH